eukprot:6112758-Pyramimonas_sp.AAC.1
MFFGAILGLYRLSWGSVGIPEGAWRDPARGCWAGWGHQAIIGGNRRRCGLPEKPLEPGAGIAWSPCG